MMRRVLVIACCALGASAPGTALAAGGPVPAVQGGSGISVRGSVSRYVAVGVGRTTIVKRINRTSGKVERSSPIAGRFGIALAANDGSTTGLSADGRMLVLAEMAGSRAPTRTRLVVFDARGLLVHARIVLAGYYAEDAISQTGRLLYLIHYMSPNDLNRYEVRAYALSSQRLLSDPVIDPRERGAMHGLPVTRVMSADGRWAYTLYDRPGSTPFIHALDTQRRAAVCVDLPGLSSADVWSSRLALAHRGETLRVELGGIPLAAVDTRTFVVGHPAAKPSPAATTRRASAAGLDGELAWVLGVLVVALGALGLLALRRSKVRSAASTQWG